MKTRKEVRRVSAKQLKKHPELARAGSTIVRSGTPVARSPRKSAKWDSQTMGTERVVKPTRKRIRVKPRSSDEFERIYGPPEFQVWMRAKPCHFCRMHLNVEICHAKTGGKGRKADWTETLPMCGWRYQTYAEVLVERRNDGALRSCHHVGGRTSKELLPIAATYHAEFASLFPEIVAQWNAHSSTVGLAGKMPAVGGA